MHLTFESELPVSVINSAKLKHNFFLIWTVGVFQEVFSFAITCCLLYVLFSPNPPCRSRWRKRDSTQLSLKNKQSLFCRYFIETDHENWHKKHNKTRKQLEENNYRVGTVQTGIGSYLLSLLPGDSILRMAADRKIFIKSRKQLVSFKLPDGNTEHWFRVARCSKGESMMCDDIVYFRKRYLFAFVKSSSQR